MDNGWDHFAESVRLGVNPCPLWDKPLVDTFYLIWDIGCSKLT
jgi:hypothetical protein